MSQSKFEVIGPLKKSTTLRIVNNPFADDGVAVASQYSRCMFRDDDEHIDCFHLTVGAKQRIVGFLGLSTWPEFLGADLYAHVSIQYVFLKPQFRMQGLSKVLRNFALIRTMKWLDENFQTGATNKCFSESTAESSEGALFLMNFDHAMARFCKDRAIDFVPSLDAD